MALAEGHGPQNQTERCPLPHDPVSEHWVVTQSTCYQLVNSHTLEQFGSSEQSIFQKAADYCRSFGGTLAASRRYQDWSQAVWQYRNVTSWVALGMSSGDLSVPNLYRYISLADDSTVLYHSGIPPIQGLMEDRSCSYLQDGEVVRNVRCGVRNYKMKKAMCEFTRYKRTEPAFIPLRIVSDALFTQEKFTTCENGEVTYRFLQCGLRSVCQKGHSALCVFYSDKFPGTYHDSVTIASKPVFMFHCDDGDTELSHTFVCDFRPDCQDKTDESFCTHPSCDSFTCNSGQCVSFNRRCDRMSDCTDDSDEMDCEYYSNLEMLSYQYLPAPVLVNFDGMMDMVLSKMTPGDPCPVSHFRCPGDVNDCLPIYSRCNGMYDCLDREDEEDCEGMTCPGFYRCRSHTVCVHSVHVCDGWPHCPLHDDELLCDVTCPDGCACHGHAFRCLQPFHASLFSQLRYLDAAGSGMTLSELSNSTYLVRLSLAGCSLTTISVMNLRNLYYLDLSENKLEHIDMAVFVPLQQLQQLCLAKNPFTLLCNEASSVTYQTSLKTLDLSLSKLTVFDSQMISSFVSIRVLNLSYTSIQTIGPDGFRSISDLTSLSIEGTPIKTIPPGVFNELSRLSSVSAQFYKFCCKDILPDHFNEKFCSAPGDEISSCEDLLPTNIYRAFLWLISSMSVAGNTFCFVTRLHVQKTSVGTYSLFVSNLSVSDFLMGVYLFIIGAADEIYRGDYLFHDDAWVSSVTCKIAGFLSLLSSEVSAMIICLISLDRAVVIRFPFGNFRFEKKSSSMACVSVWSVGVLFAVLPLLPSTSHWEFYSQTGICIPLPVTRQEFKGHLYSFSVLIVFNFVLFMLISVCQTFIYWSIKENTLTCDTTRISQDMTIARRLIAVAVTDFLCWFPIGLCGFLALLGIPIPGEVNVAFAIFLLPLNSALNPFVYTFNALAEKRRKQNEAKLLTWLDAKSALLEKKKTTID